MKKYLLVSIIFLSCIAKGQVITVPESDLHAKERLLQDFISFDSSYVKKRSEAAIKAKLLAQKVFELEAKGYNTSCLHQILYEAGSLLYSSANFKLINQRLNELEAAVSSPETQTDIEIKDPTDDSYGKCYVEWFLKVVASYNQLEKITVDNPKPTPLPRFLECINTPEKLEDYLTSISVSDIRKTGVDNEREYNEMHATLLEMIIKGSPQNYIVDSVLRHSFKNLLFNKLRNPLTGWWGESYIRNGHTEFVDDLSTTFHTVSYLKGNVPEMGKIIATLLAVKNVPYPVGWLWKNEYWNHNNMDVVTIFKYGWQQSNEQLRNEMSSEIDKMLQWCLTSSLQPDGSFKNIPEDGSIEEAQYYGTSFLARIGYFDKSKRFWTNKDFPEASAIKDKLITYIKQNQKTGGSGGDYYKNALEALDYSESK
jgi:hypothetical protein